MSTDPDPDAGDAGDGRQADGEAPLAVPIADGAAGADGADAAPETEAGTAEATDESPDPEALGRRLGAAIAETPEYEAFEAAEAAVENDEEVQEAIAAFERQRSQYVLDEQTGRADESDLAALKEAQRELHAMPTMQAYLTAQDELSERLSAVNDAISAELAVDFGGEAGGCCHD